MTNVSVLALLMVLNAKMLMHKRLFCFYYFFMICSENCYILAFFAFTIIKQLYTLYFSFKILSQRLYQHFSFQIIKTCLYINIFACAVGGLRSIFLLGILSDFLFEIEIMVLLKVSFRVLILSGNICNLRRYYLNLSILIIS